MEPRQPSAYNTSRQYLSICSLWDESLLPLGLDAWMQFLEKERSSSLHTLAGPQPLEQTRFTHGDAHLQLLCHTADLVLATRVPSVTCWTPADDTASLQNQNQRSWSCTAVQPQHRARWRAWRTAPQGSTEQSTSSSLEGLCESGRLLRGDITVLGPKSSQGCHECAWVARKRALLLRTTWSMRPTPTG